MMQSLERELERAVQELRSPPYAEMAEMIAYHLGWWDPTEGGKGKRIRPLLTLLTCEATGGSWQKSIPAAAAVELIHNFSLIHDDIEDWSETRRGRATVWKRWGVPQAINSGDALFVMARLAALNLTELNLPAPQVLHVLRLLDTACLRLTMGQYLDLSFEKSAPISVDEYMEMIGGKTAALVAAATEVGALIAGAEAAAVESSRKFGWHLGMAFQITDDVLGIWGDEAVTGKSAAGDLLARKKTMPVIYGLEASPAFQRLWIDQSAGEASLEEMVHLLERVGADDHARMAAEGHTQRAFEALTQFSGADFAGEELRRVAGKLLKRDR
jgi:geranylgeranyl diphosphate synthase type I